MHILIDECVDERLRNSFSEHDCQTVRYAGLAGLKNGELLDAIELAHFDALVTVDRGWDVVGMPSDNCGSGHLIGCINSAAFGLPAPFTFGNARRNILYRPGLVDADFSLLKDFPIKERAKLQFRAEMFNIFNHPNFGSPNTTFNTGSFGNITQTTTDNRDIQFGAKFIFEGGQMRHLFTALFLLALVIPARAQQPTQQPKYDLLLKGGHVIDPANGLDAKMDVAVLLGRIAAVQKDIPANDAGKVVDVSGLYVTPGLIDIHYHIGHGGASLNWFAPDSSDHEIALLTAPTSTQIDPHAVLVPYGVPADLALQSGVTTIVDAGSAGADAFLQEKEEVIEHAKVRVLVFLNIVSNGMKGGLEQTVDNMDVKRCADTVLRYSDIIVGVKTAHYWPQRPLDELHPTWAAVDRAIACADAAKVPVMYDFWPRPERSYADLILQKARPGDIHTHVFAQQFPIIVDGKLNPIMQQARARGVIFDVGHGAGSFWFRNAVPAVKQGFVPDSMSTDLHIGDFTTVSMSNVMSKFLSMGVPLADLIRRSTVNPANEIHRPELGTLTVGREADIAVLDEQHGHFGFVDCGYAKMEGTSRVVAQMTIRAGRILYDPSGLSMVPWEKARPQYFNTPMLQGSLPATADSYPRN